MAGWSGPLDQVPSSVSAVKVDGERAYARVRRGEQVALAPRRVHVHAFDVLATAAVGDHTDLEVRVVCSSGTYVRALARDLGAALDVGGHLTRLRRTAVGPFSLAEARSLDQLAERFEVLDLTAAATAAFPVLALGADQARQVRHGAALAGVALPDGAGRWRCSTRTAHSSRSTHNGGTTRHRSQSSAAEQVWPGPGVGTARALDPGKDRARHDRRARQIR